MARRTDFLVSWDPETYFPYSPNSCINSAITCIIVLMAAGTLSGLRVYLPINYTSGATATGNHPRLCHRWQLAFFPLDMG